MVDIITKENLFSVLNEAIKKMDEAKSILYMPGCENDKVGAIRCTAVNAITKANAQIASILKNLYLLD